VDLVRWENFSDGQEVPEYGWTIYTKKAGSIVVGTNSVIHTPEKGKLLHRCLRNKRQRKEQASESEKTWPNTQLDRRHRYPKKHVEYF
jgi:hypothetical protein